VADETRRQRRDARRAAGESSTGDKRPADDQPRGRIVPQPAVAGGADVVAASGGSSAGRRRFAFVGESIDELKKVDWPNRSQVIQGTIVVIVACVVIGLFLWLADLGLKPFVRDVLLRN
jgi:preprotein translocase subunit SecE